MNIPENSGRLVLAIYLILIGITGVFGIQLGPASVLLPILALAAGILILLGRLGGTHALRQRRIGRSSGCRDSPAEGFDPFLQITPVDEIDDLHAVREETEQQAVVNADACSQGVGQCFEPDHAHKGRWLSACEAAQQFQRPA